MRAAQHLQRRDVITSPLLDEKTGVPRVVVKVKPRTALTYVETHHKNAPNIKEVFELRSTTPLVVDSPNTNNHQGAKSEKPRNHRSKGKK
jgi:hypothetical protein